jgi:DNA mismatch repair protein MutS
MSGKSTYMRQVGLIVVLAQAGGFVPAESASLPVVDRVFTRVGASDDIAGGRSTFMVEMTELADILDHATERSLVLLDEVGRGTSTADGLAIARAVTEFIHDEVGAWTLFATHHHELTGVAEQLAGVSNLHFRTHHEDGEVVFEHTVERGAAAASYGVEVASTAGVPDAVVSRARELLDDGSRSRQPVDAGRTNGQATTAAGPGLSLAGSDSEDGSEKLAPAVRERLAAVDVATMTPLEALNTLAELDEMVDD